MHRTLMLAAAAILAGSPALAQQPAAPAAAPAQAAPPAPAAAPAQAGQPPQGQPARDVPLARVMSDGALVRGVDSKDRIILQLGKFVFICRHGDGKPALCDLVY